MIPMARWALATAVAVYLAAAMPAGLSSPLAGDVARSAGGAVQSGLSAPLAGEVARSIGTGVSSPLRGEVARSAGGDAQLTTTSTNYAPAIWIPAAATNYTVAVRPHDYPVDGIVIHDIEGSAADAIKTFQNRTRFASAHYVISYAGQVWQMVLEKDVAWHAGNWDYNTRTIGIEHEGFAWTPGLYTTAEYKASAQLAASICSRWGVPMDRSHVIGHSDVPDPFNPGLFGGADHHTDPGPYWNWTYYLSLAQTYANALPSPPHMMVDPSAVPDDHSASVTWRPAHTCHAPITSYHVVLQPGNIVQDLPGDATTATFGGLQNGSSYSFTVTAINAYGQDTMQSNSVLAGPHCTSASLTTNLASPQLLGNRIQLSVSSVGCPNPQYQFWLNSPAGSWVVAQPFGGGTWTWDTSFYRPGTYTIRVWANQTGDHNSSEAFADVVYSMIEPPPCTSAGLSPSNPTPPAGSTVSFTASATGCPIPLYAFWVQYPNGTWTLQRNLSTDATWNWNTAGLVPGTYTVNVWANHPGHSRAFLEVVASSTVTLTGCTSASLGATTRSQPAGSTVAFTATSGGGCPNPVYDYWVMFPNGQWSLLRGFSSDPNWSWDTTGLSPGTYTVHTWANQQGAYTGAWEAFGTTTVTLTGCTSATLSPASGSSKVGTSVVFTAGSVGCAAPVYEFWIQTTGGNWYLMQPFSTTPTWTWTNVGWPKGVYHIHVWANLQGAYTGTFETYASSTYTLT